MRYYYDVCWVWIFFLIVSVLSYYFHCKILSPYNTFTVQYFHPKKLSTYNTFTIQYFQHTIFSPYNTFTVQYFHDTILSKSNKYNLSVISSLCRLPLFAQLCPRTLPQINGSTQKVGFSLSQFLFLFFNSELLCEDLR